MNEGEAGENAAGAKRRVHTGSVEGKVSELHERRRSRRECSRSEAPGSHRGSADGNTGVQMGVCE